jgi:hypothetical protein
MAGQEFKAKAKEVLQMNSDGATVKNLADDSEIRVSQREETLNYHEDSGDIPLTVLFPRIPTERQNLSEFTNRKIRKQRKYDILDEKHESKLDKAIYDSQRLKDDFIAEKKLVSAKRSGIIRTEYGSIGEYNRFSEAAKANDCRDELIKSKLKLQKQRNALITDEYGGRLKFNEARKSVNFKPSDSLKTVDNKLTSVNGQIKAESGKLNGFYASHGLAEMKSSNSREKLKSLQRKMLQKSERLTALENRYSDLGGKIKTESAKIKEFTAEKDGIIAERKNLNSVRNTDKSKVEDRKINLKTAKSNGEKLEIKAAKADYRLAKTQYKLPKQRIVRKTYAFDEKSGKVKTRLEIEKEVKPIDGRGGIVSKGIKGGAKAISTTAAVGIHRQISKYEEDNSALKAAHGTEKAVEGVGRIGVRTVKAIGTKIREAPYKKASKLKFRSEKENAKLRFSKSVTQNKETVKSAESDKKSSRKTTMKKSAQKLQKSAGNKAKNAVSSLGKKVTEALAKNKYVAVGIAAALLLTVVISGIFGSFAMMFSESSGVMIASTYMSEDSDMRNSENYMTELESGLRPQINNIPNIYAGWDEYRYSLAEIGHDPHQLISYLSAKYIVFEYNGLIQSDIIDIFSLLYTLRIESIVEERRAEYPPKYLYFHDMKTGNMIEVFGGYYRITSIGNDYGGNWDIELYDPNTEEYILTTAYDVYIAGYAVIYDWYVLQTTLTKADFNNSAQSLLDADMYELYLLLLETEGNRPDLF